MIVQQKAIDTDCYDSVLSLHQLNQRQEYLEGDPQPRNKQQARILTIAVCVECHLCLFSDLGGLQLPNETPFAILFHRSQSFREIFCLVVLWFDDETSSGVDITAFTVGRQCRQCQPVGERTHIVELRLDGHTSRTVDEAVFDNVVIIHLDGGKSVGELLEVADFVTQSGYRIVFRMCSLV